LSKYVVMGACGEYSDRQVWPACVVEHEAVARDLVMRFQSECRALLTEWKRRDIGHYDDNFKDLIGRLFKLLPDPSFESRYAAEPDLMDRMICYISADEWSYYYVEVSGAPDLGPPLTDAREALTS
jgi:hypothetical protein